MIAVDAIPDRSIEILSKFPDEYINLEELKHQLFLNPDLKAWELWEILERGKVFRD